MTLAQIIDKIGNGNVPSFADLAECVDGMDRWHIRNACFGDIASAITACNEAGMKWRIGYDNRAEIDDITVISVTPAHALILAALQTLEKRRAGAEATTARQ